MNRGRVLRRVRCFLGGVNGSLTIGHGREDEIRQAAREAIRTLGPRAG